MSLQILKNVRLDQYTSWLIGGEAENFCLPQTREDLLKALNYARDHHLNYTILGGGSNVLVSDVGVKGLVIGLRRFNQIESVVENNLIKITALSGSQIRIVKTIFKK